MSVVMYHLDLFFSFFFFNDTATTEIYTLSLHDALPICLFRPPDIHSWSPGQIPLGRMLDWPVLSPESEDSPRTVSAGGRDRKSTRLNSSHSQISYAVFCLKKKKKYQPTSS